MLDAIFKKLFGDKSQKDLKELLPVVDQVNSEFDKIQGISDDELRGKTKKFKQRIQDYIKTNSTQNEHEFKQVKNKLKLMTLRNTSQQPRREGKRTIKNID